MLIQACLFEIDDPYLIASEGHLLWHLALFTHGLVKKYLLSLVTSFRTFHSFHKLNAAWQGSW